MPQPSRVLIVHDQRLLSDAIGAWLNRQSGLSSCGSAATIEELFAVTRITSFDVVLIGADMANMDPLQTTRLIKDNYPDVEVIIFGLETAEEDLLQFIEAGANAHVLKSSPASELWDLIADVREGRTSCSPRVAALVFARIRELSRLQGAEEPLLQVKLTPRELEVLRLMAADSSNSDVAERLGIALVTAKNHVQHVLEKFHAHSRREAIRYAYEQGVIARDFSEPETSDTAS